VIARLVSTVALWALVFAAIGFFGAAGGVVLLAALAVLAQYEVQVLLEKSGLPPWKLAPLALGAGIMLTAGSGRECETYLAVLAALALVLGVLAVARDAAALPRLAGSILALAYAPGLLCFYPLIMHGYGTAASRGGGVGLAVWVIAAAKFTDVGGYLVGTAFGKHKLAPHISPGKTWEGVVGGLIFSALVGALTAHFAAAWLPSWLSAARAAEFALPIGVAAIISDLSESALKRRAGVKDSGLTIPGIGGALDLADSLLLAGPVAYGLFEAFR
jgi:phosphatidate cytidylyltransferase